MQMQIQIRTQYLLSICYLSELALSRFTVSDKIYDVVFQRNNFDSLTVFSRYSLALEKR